MLLTAVMVSSIFSIALSVRRGGAKSERRLVAAEATRQLTATLKTYVTGDPATTLLPGPGSGPNPWSLDSPTVNDTSCAGCYALSPGSHVLTGFLPPWFEGPPYNAMITYYVAYPQAYQVAKGTVPWVNVSVDWSEP